MYITSRSRDLASIAERKRVVGRRNVPRRERRRRAPCGGVHRLLLPRRNAEREVLVRPFGADAVQDRELRVEHVVREHEQRARVECARHDVVVLGARIRASRQTRAYAEWVAAGRNTTARARIVLCQISRRLYDVAMADESRSVCRGSKNINVSTWLTFTTCNPINER